MPFSWRIATVPQRCGRCGEPIAVDDAYLAIYLEHVKHFRVRCLLCAKYHEPFTATPEPAAPTFSRAPVEPVARPFQPLNEVAADFKLQQAADREPGCDD
jgi:hypothetical protein